MIEVKKGDIIKLTDKVKQGEGQKGKYIMIPIEAEKGYEKITVWVDNADSFSIDGKKTARVKEIISATKSRRKYNDKFYDNFSCSCVLEDDEVVSFDTEGGSGLASDDEDLPFV